MTRSPHRDPDAFVRAQTEITTTPLLGPISLHLASDQLAIFAAAEDLEFARPYWAFAWPGGQALARYVMDHPESIAGNTVLDIGAGSGVAAIAALQAGAAAAVANDTDPNACVVARLNADLNGVKLEISGDDLLDSAVDADVVLIGDLVYEPQLLARVTDFLKRARTSGTTILFGDRYGIAPPVFGWRELAAYEAPLIPPMEPGYTETGRVWQLD